MGFTKAEAEAKVGQWIKTRIEWLGVEAGTIGKVVKADSLGEVWSVVIRWDWPRTRHDWFTKDEYKKFLEEI